MSLRKQIAHARKMLATWPAYLWPANPYIKKPKRAPGREGSKS